MKQKSKAFLSIFMLIALFIISDANNVWAGLKQREIGNDTYQCVSNGVSKYTEYPTGGKHHFTYETVIVDEHSKGNGMLYTLVCNDPGIWNCMFEPGLRLIYVDKKTDDGRIVYTKEYAEEYVNNAATYIDAKINEGVNSGKESDNEQKNEFLIYRNFSWSVDPETKVIRTEVNISVLELVEE